MIVEFAPIETECSVILGAYVAAMPSYGVYGKLIYSLRFLLGYMSSSISYDAKIIGVDPAAPSVAPCYKASKTVGALLNEVRLTL